LEKKAIFTIIERDRTRNLGHLNVEKKVEGVQGAWWMPVASRAEEGRG
jgi:hypothetical protein